MRRRNDAPALVRGIEAAVAQRIDLDTARSVRRCNNRHANTQECVGTAGTANGERNKVNTEVELLVAGLAVVPGHPVACRVQPVAARSLVVKDTTQDYGSMQLPQREVRLTL